MTTKPLGTRLNHLCKRIVYAMLACLINQLMSYTNCASFLSLPTRRRFNLALVISHNSLIEHILGPIYMVRLRLSDMYDQIQQQRYHMNHRGLHDQIDLVRLLILVAVFSMTLYL